MKVALLCGGINKRMAPITRDKSLSNFVGKPLILHQINVAREAGLSQFVIVANPGNEADLKLAVAGIEGVDIHFAVQKEPMGMADALISASALLAEEPFIVVNPNDIFEVSAYTELLNEYHRGGGYSGYIVAHRVRSYFPGGYLMVDEDNELSGIVEKPSEGDEPSDLVNIVVHLYTEPGKVLNYLAGTKSKTDDVYEKSLELMIQDGHKMKAVVYEGTWQAIKYPWHILDAMDYFLSRISQRISPAAQISDKAVIDGVVVIEDSARVLEGAVVRGPSYIGRNSIVGNGVLIRDSIVGNDCVVGFGTEIKHSYIGDKCWFHSNYIGDSVVEDDCSFGAGAVLANLRLDEAEIKIKIDDKKIGTGSSKLGAIIGKGCRIGVNASIMPGVRVGAGSFVGAQVCLSRDLGEAKIAVDESRYQVLPNNIVLSEDRRQQLFRKLVD